MKYPLQTLFQLMTFVVLIWIVSEQRELRHAIESNQQWIGELSFRQSTNHWRTVKRLHQGSYERQELRYLIETVNPGIPQGVSWGCYSDGLPDAYLKGVAEANGVYPRDYGSMWDLLEELEVRAIIRREGGDRIDLNMDAQAQYREYMKRYPDRRKYYSALIKEELGISAE